MVITGVLLMTTTETVQAQAAAPAYYVAEVYEVKDAEDFKTYGNSVAAIVGKYDGTYLTRGGKTDSLEGEVATRIVVISFKTMADARKWYDSPEYSAIRPIRQRSTRSRAYIVEGRAP
jgi:uncharacterized protein (DUF1330 family)